MSHIVTTSKLRILPLGGLGEIGMNCMVLEWGAELILIDCGIQFADWSYTGVELLAPDFSYVRSRLDRLKGVVITHGHDDHIGAIPFLARETPLDIYCTPFPKGLLRAKLSEYSHLKEIRFHEIKPRQVFKVGSFSFDPIPVAHSIIEALAFGIETPLGNLIHSGDFKHDEKVSAGGEGGDAPITFDPFHEWGKKGVELLLSDSTNAERAGHTLSESDIAHSFEEIFRKQTGRLFVALFASNIRRVEKLLEIAAKAGKKVAFAGRSMHLYTKLANEQRSLDIPPDTLILLENLHQHPDQEVIVLATGSQAEPQSALVRIAHGTHRDVHIRPGDQVILSSRFIPGNERAITGMIDQLYREGADVMYESIHQIHVSGHGFQDELMMLLNAVKPKCFVPIHGEYRHLMKHALLAKQSGVAATNALVVENGQVVELSAQGISLGEKIELHKTAIIEGSMVDGTETVISQRLNLMKTGIVFVTLLRDFKTLELLRNPSITSHGLLYKKNIEPFEVAEDAAELARSLYYDRPTRSDLEEHLRIELRRFYKKRVSHKPIIIPLVLEV